MDCTAHSTWRALLTKSAPPSREPARPVAMRQVCESVHGDEEGGLKMVHKQMRRIALVALVIAIAMAFAAPAWAATDGPWSYEIESDGSATITGWVTSPDRIAIIPSTIGGATVKTIGSYAFWNNGVSEVDIPGTVETIRDHAFVNCGGLVNVIMHEGLKTIGQQAFYTCGNLTTITIPSTVTSIGGWAFNGNPRLLRAIFKGNAPAMGPFVFHGSDPVFKIYVPNGSTGYAPDNMLPAYWPATEGNYTTVYVIDEWEAPTITYFMVTPATQSYGGRIDLVVEATDNVYVTRVQYRIDEGAWADMTWDTTYMNWRANFSDASIGNHTVYVRAGDAANNFTGEYFVGRSFTVVKRTFATSLASPNSSGTIYLKRPYTISGTVTPADAPGSVAITVLQKKGKAWRQVRTATAAITDGAWSYDFTPTAKGAWQVWVQYKGGENATDIWQWSDVLKCEYTVVAAPR